MDRNTLINKITAYGIFLLLLDLLMSQFGFRMEILSVQPVLSVFAVAAVAMFEGSSAGMAAGFMLGVLSDAVASQYTVFHIVMYMLMGLLCGYLCRRYFRKKLATVLLLGTMASLAVNLVRLLFVFLIFDRAPLSALWTVVLPEAAYSALFSPFIFLIVRLIHKKTCPDGDLPV